MSRLEAATRRDRSTLGLAALVVSGTLAVAGVATSRSVGTVATTGERGFARGIRCGLDRVAGARYRFCEIDPSAVELRTFWLDPDGQRIGDFARLQRLVRRRGQRLVLAMNGGMYGGDERSTPQGLYVEDGRQLVPPNVRDSSGGNFYAKPNGVFYVEGRRAGILETSAFRRAAIRPRWATQSGPLLVQGGTFPHRGYTPNGPTAATRNGVGVRRDGRVVLVMALDPTSMYAFRAALRDHFHARDALYLDGGVSQFYVTPDRVPAGSVFGAILAVVDSADSR